jgi:hypothetical protein
MQTALQELIDWLPVEAGAIIEKAKSLLKKEREQIVESFVAGDERGTKDIPFNAEQYFNQTYQP